MKKLLLLLLLLYILVTPFVLVPAVHNSGVSVCSSHSWYLVVEACFAFTLAPLVDGYNKNTAAPASLFLF